MKWSNLLWFPYRVDTDKLTGENRWPDGCFLSQHLLYHADSTRTAQLKPHSWSALKTAFPSRYQPVLTLSVELCCELTDKQLQLRSDCLQDVIKIMICFW